MTFCQPSSQGSQCAASGSQGQPGVASHMAVREICPLSSSDSLMIMVFLTLGHLLPTLPCLAFSYTLVTAWDEVFLESRFGCPRNSSEQHQGGDQRCGVGC